MLQVRQRAIAVTSCALVLSGDVWSRMSLTALASDAVSSPCANGRLTLRRRQSALAFLRTNAMMSSASPPPSPPGASLKPTSLRWAEMLSRPGVSNHSHDQSTQERLDLCGRDAAATYDEGCHLLKDRYRDLPSWTRSFC